MAEKDGYIFTRHTRQLPFTYVYIIFELHFIFETISNNSLVIYVSIHALTIQKHIK